MKCIYYTSIFT